MQFISLIHDQLAQKLCILTQMHNLFSSIKNMYLLKKTKLKDLEFLRILKLQGRN